jgi:ubiquinone/menaquinone biosynthesis C-methylase UbiE
VLRTYVFEKNLKSVHDVADNEKNTNDAKMLQQCILTLAIILRIDISEALSLDPFDKKFSETDSVPEFSRRELLTVPVAAGGTVLYGKLLSSVTRKLTRGDLVYPDSHERRVKATITEAVLASIRQSQTYVKKDAANDRIGRPLRILEVGIGKDCRVIRRELYNEAFAEASSRGVASIDLIGVDTIVPTTTALESAKDVLLRKEEDNNHADVSFEFVRGSLTSRLDFPDGYFDCIICALTLCSVDDQIAALSEVKRVLRKDGGSFGYIEHVAVNPGEPYRLLEFQQLAFDGVQQKLADNCHLHRFTEENISSVFGVADGTSRSISNERFLVDDMWPVSCQASGVIQLS